MRLAHSALILLLLTIPAHAFADAVLYVSPEKGSYTVGQTFEIKVYADSGGSLINAAEGDIAFNTDALQVETVSKEGSILQKWSLEPEFSNTEGTIHFAGWTKINYNGPNALLVTVKFKAIKNMVANARLAAGAILAADGQESNIISSMRSGIFTINAVPEPEEIVSTENGSATTSADEFKSKVPAPNFDEIDDRISVGDRIVARGIAEPNSNVYITIQYGSDPEERTGMLSATDGSFTFVSDTPVKAGVYHLRGSVETPDGRISVPSEVIDIEVSETGLAASAALSVGILFESVPFLALLVLAGLGAAYIFHRHQLAKMHYGQHEMFEEQ